jgi:ATP phosphoribosyltransferase regulatory subunit
VERLWADIEVLLVAIDSLLHLGITDFKVVLGHVGFFNGIVERLSLTPEKANALRNAIDHKDVAWLKKEVAGVRMSEKKRRFLVGVPDFAGGREVISQALGIVENPRSRAALLDLREIEEIVAALELSGFLTFDLAEVRGLDYYTGIVFKIYGRAAGLELGGGGRYDGLLARFGRDLPAVGFSFTLDRLLPLIADASKLEAPAQDGEEQVLSTRRGKLKEVFRQAWDMRRQGLPVRLGEKP